MLLDEAEVNLQRILRAVKENKARIEQLVALACVSYDHMGKSMHQEVALSPEDHTLMFPHRIITEEE
jgi:NAD kinase